MSRRRTLKHLLSALALCAVALLNVAVVKSAVMQASMEVGAETCRDTMPGMAGMARAPVRPGKASHRTCEFCAAAAHVPVETAVATVALPGSVAWSPFRSWTSRGPRGPPSRRPRARGPPTALLTIA